MWTLVGIVAAIVALSVYIHRVNDRYEARERVKGPSPDDRVAAAWDDFGGHDSPDALSDSLEALTAEAPVEALTDKTALSRLAIMALRAERADVVRACADRIHEIGPGCGEARTLGVLAAACEGDLGLARALYAESLAAIAGCASCGASETSRILSQEVSMILGDDRPRPRAA